MARTKNKAQARQKQVAAASKPKPTEPARPWHGKVLAIHEPSGVAIYVTAAEKARMEREKFSNTPRNPDAEAAIWLNQCKPHLAVPALGNESVHNLDNPDQWHPPMPIAIAHAIAADIRRDCIEHNHRIAERARHKAELERQEAAARAARYRQARANGKVQAVNDLKEYIRWLETAPLQIR